MNVGFLLECGPGGADSKVFEHLVRKLRPSIQPRFTCSVSKRILFNDCRDFVAKLFDAERCDHVFVVWDLAPCDEVFKDEKGVACLKRERDYLRNALRPEDRARTILLCIPHELEAWLLADGGALTAALENKNHPKKSIPDDKDPERHLNPKAVLTKIFQNNKKARGYEDYIWAARIIQHVDPVKVARRAPSFARFNEKLIALEQVPPGKHKGPR